MFKKSRRFKAIVVLVLIPLLLYANCSLDHFHDIANVRTFLYSDPSILPQSTKDGDFATIFLEQTEIGNLAGTSNYAGTRGTYLISSFDIKAFRKKLIARATEFEKKGFSIFISEPIHAPDDKKIHWVDPDDYLLVIVEVSRDMRWYEID
ncbi:MAG: hypothetical protein WCG75_12780 [Armatimonadota bacterium]